MSDLAVNPFASSRRRGLQAKVFRWGGNLLSLAVKLSLTVRGWIMRSGQRKALRELATFNDHLLKDIGLSPEQAWREAAKWFWQK